MSRIRSGKEQALNLFEAVLSKESDADKFAIITDAKDTLSKPFVKRFFYSEMMTVIEFFLCSEDSDFAAYCKEVKFSVAGESELIISDYAKNEVTLAKQQLYHQTTQCYYLFHPLKGKVKVQRWTTDGGCSSDFVANTISEAIQEVGAERLELVPESHRDELQDQFLESEARVQKNRAEYEARFYVN